jgi:hypothetical protein
VVQIKEGYCMCSGKTEDCADHRLSTGFGIGPSRCELQRTKDTTYPVGALRFCLHVASFEIWGVLPEILGQISKNCNSLSLS